MIFSSTPALAIAITSIFSTLAYLLYKTVYRPQIIKVLVANENNVVKFVASNNLNASPKKIAIIFGWSGAEQRHLRRLQEYYQSQNTSTFSYIHSTITHLDRGIAPQLLLPLLRDLHNHYQSLSDEDQTNTTIMIHSFSDGGALCTNSLLYILRFFPQPTKASPHFGYLLQHIAGVIYESGPSIVGLNHITVPANFQQHVTDTLVSTTPLTPTPPVPGEQLTLDYNLERMSNPLYLLYHAFTVTQYITGLIKSRTTKFHPIYSPFIMCMFTYYYLYHRFCKPVRWFLSKLGLASKEKVKPRYSSFTNELRPGYMTPVYAEEKPSHNDPNEFVWFDMDDLECGTVCDSNCDMPMTTTTTTTTTSTSTSTNSNANSVNQRLTSNTSNAITNPYQLISYERLISVLTNNPYPVPELFIYSDEDERISEMDVLKLMYIHVRRGVSVHKAKFNHGKHCGIVLEEPDEYKEVLSLFNSQMVLQKRIELAAAQRRRF